MRTPFLFISAIHSAPRAAGFIPAGFSLHCRRLSQKHNTAGINRAARRLRCRRGPATTVSRAASGITKLEAIVPLRASAAEGWPIGKSVVLVSCNGPYAALDWTIRGRLRGMRPSGAADLARAPASLLVGEGFSNGPSPCGVKSGGDVSWWGRQPVRSACRRCAPLASGVISRSRFRGGGRLPLSSLTRALRWVGGSFGRRGQ
jgi:hypothetical protein